MTAYVVVDVTIHDPSHYEEYKQMAQESVACHGGRYVARGGATEVLEGDWQPNRFVMLEFPTMEQARGWWSSEDYGPAKALRQKIATTNMVVVQGV